jgi:plasmid stabilization system protein ParE
MRSFEVFLTNSAASDPEGIIGCISEHDSPEKAGYVLSKIDKVLGSLSTAPERGSYPNEL